jgi:hypothetical protein
MTSQGSPYTRLDRALATGDPLAARMAAVECPRLSVADALRIVLAHAYGRDAHYGRLAARWAAMLTRERPVQLDDLHALVDALLALGADPTVEPCPVEAFAQQAHMDDIAAAVRRQRAHRRRA